MKFALISGYAKSSLTPAVKILQAIQDYVAGLNQDKRGSAEKEFDEAISKLAQSFDIVKDDWFDIAKPARNDSRSMLIISSEHKWAYAKVLRKQYHQTVDMLFKFYIFLIILNWLHYSFDDLDKVTILDWTLRNMKTQYLGSWGHYHVFSGKFKNWSTRRIAKGYAIIFTRQENTLADGNGSREIPRAFAIHGELRHAKALIRLSNLELDGISRVYWHGRTNRAYIKAAKRLSGESIMSNYDSIYHVATPAGLFDAVFDEDESPVQYQGDEAGILF